MNFKNRKVTYSWFEKEELKNIRNNFNVNNKDFSFDTINTIEEVKDTFKYEDKLTNKNQKFAFSMGFSSFITIFLSAIWFLDIFMIALWIFKALK